MNREFGVQLSQLLDNTNPETIYHFVKNLFTENYPEVDFSSITTAFFKVKDLFNGNFKDFAACNTPYHNYPHTLDVFLTTARILDGYLQEHPEHSTVLSTNCLLAALFHDVGYIMKKDDHQGTGAKFTRTHVDRSVNFIMEYYGDFELHIDILASMGRMIKSTHLAYDFNSIEFNNDAEKITAAILSSADLVGQMSNRDYLERLLFLYYEFREANIPGYETEFDILRKTLAFYEMTKDRLKTTLMNISQYAQNHFKLRNNIDNDLYHQAILRQINYLKKIIEDESTNFRKKLHRGKWIDADIKVVG